MLGILCSQAAGESVSPRDGNSTETARAISARVNSGMPDDTPVEMLRFFSVVGYLCDLAGKYDLLESVFEVVSSTRSRDTTPRPSIFNSQESIPQPDNNVNININNIAVSTRQH